MESPKVDGAETPAGSASERSTIEFPYSDIDNAIEIVRGIHAVGGTACEYEQLAAHLNAEAKGGGFRLRVNGAKTYGLIDYERGGTITITDLGHRIIDPNEERSARAEAFLCVPLYVKVYEAFKGRQLPPQAGLERTIKSFGVGPKVADRARQVMLRSAKQAGYMDLAADRLTAPPIKAGDKAAELQSDTPKGIKTGGSGGGSGHPFIDGLIRELPAPNTPWSSEGRRNWLVTANSIFKMIYQSEDRGDITIELKQPQKGKTDIEDLL